MTGLVNPAAIQLAEAGWYVVMMQYKGCFGSDCPLQVIYLTSCVCVFFWHQPKVHACH